MQIPRAFHWANHVVASLDDHGRDVSNAADLFDELVVGAQETAIHEVVTLDPRERRRVGVLLKLGDVTCIHSQKTRRAFPDRPGSGSDRHDVRIFAGETLIVGAHHVRALGLGDGLDVLLPQIGVERGRSARALIEPFEFPAAQ